MFSIRKSTEKKLCLIWTDYFENIQSYTAPSSRQYLLPNNCSINGDKSVWKSSNKRDAYNYYAHAPNEKHINYYTNRLHGRSTYILKLISNNRNNYKFITITLVITQLKLSQNNYVFYELYYSRCAINTILSTRIMYLVYVPSHLLNKTLKNKFWNVFFKFVLFIIKFTQKLLLINIIKIIIIIIKYLVAHNIMYKYKE